MIKKHYISLVFNYLYKGVSILCICFIFLFSPSLKSQTVVVNAGQDQIICAFDTLFLDSLNAGISGAVTDGYWFTQGDGTFLPSGIANVQFSLGQAYLPGPLDKSSGGFNLILVSLDPDGIGPAVQVTDIVHISLLGNITIACNSNLNISLGNDCSQLVSPANLIANQLSPLKFYTLEIKDKFGKIVPGNIVTRDHIGQPLSYSVGHLCGTNVCWGNLNIKDLLPPNLTCTNKTVICGTNTIPDSIGLPIPALAKATKKGPKSYRVTGLDACGPASLIYDETSVKLLCETGFQNRITRTWIATDSFNNTSSCVQTITIKNKTLAQVKLPKNYDDLDRPAFECSSYFPKLANGNPSPDTTGRPDTEGCTNMESTFTDQKFASCGAGFHVLRKWTIINWCGNLITEHNQLIKVKDSRPPLFECPLDFTISTSPYSCSTYDTIPLPKNIVDCSKTYLNIKLEEQITKFDFSSYVNQTSSGRFTFGGLPLGAYTAIYILSDTCANADTCFTNFEVVDNIVPIPVCDQFTKVSLGVDGTGRLFASSLDNGSYDNCQLANLKIAKMVNKCNPNLLSFADYVDYCCEESNTYVMTILRVTDIYGNSNSCMVEVKVEDKLSPSVVCPSNVTISCKTAIDTNHMEVFGNIVKGQVNKKPFYIYDEFNNGIAGYDGYYHDNCEGTITQSFADNVSCGSGNFIRKFKVEDKNGNSTACSQIITVKISDPFDSLDIVWPSNKDINACNESSAVPSLTGNPQFTNTSCAQVAASFEDQIFKFTDGACVKIVRKWTVLDWCQFNPATNKGKWEKLQVIKIYNNIKPTLISPCKDTTFCVYNSQCGADLYSQFISASDDCHGDTLLSYYWTVDKDNNGTIDTSANNSIINIYLSPGKHKVYYEVKDECGNITSCSYFINAKDCKKPSPYCLSALSSVIMPSTGEISIKAKSLNFNSFDNCTPASLLKYSFSSDIRDTIKTIKCIDIENGVSQTFSVNMWVTDLNGNQDYCSVNLSITDNNQVCQDPLGNFSLSGTIFNLDQSKKLSNINVDIRVEDTEFRFHSVSDANGIFSHQNLPGNFAHIIKPVRNDSLRAGLSTIDLILIQRHILGASPFNDAYKIIAADADGNKKLSVSDLVALKKVILGVSNNFPLNRNCWTFVEKKHQFANINKPFDYPDSIRLTKLLPGENKLNDFIAIKIGDVNNSYIHLKRDKAENRSDDDFILNKVISSNTYSLSFKKGLNVSGLQISLLTNSKNIEINEKFRSDIYYEFKDKQLKIIFLPKKPVNVEAEDWMVRLEKDFTLDENFANELYDVDLREYKINVEENLIQNLKEEKNSEEELDIKYFNNVLIIASTSHDQNGNLQIIDVAGRNLHNLNIEIKKGSNEWQIPTFNPNINICFIKIRYKNRIKILKVVI